MKSPSPVDQYTNGYVYLIQETLDEACGSTDLLNLGFPGAQLDEVEDLQLPLAEAADPDLTTLWPGPNDLIDGKAVSEFESDLDSILNTITSNGNPRIFLATIPNLTQAPRFIEEPDSDVTIERISQFNSTIRSKSAEFGAFVVELANEPVNDLLVSDLDGFHPNDNGYQLIADRFLDQILPIECS